MFSSPPLREDLKIYAFPLNQRASVCNHQLLSEKTCFLSIGCDLGINVYGRKSHASVSFCLLPEGKRRKGHGSKREIEMNECEIRKEHNKSHSQSHIDEAFQLWL